jgi:hypothetical protein
VDQKALRALGSAFRIQLLDLIVRGTTSPKRISVALSRRGPDEGPDEALLSKTSYNVDVLREAGLIEIATTRPVRGATEHFYKPTLPSSIQWVPLVLDSAGQAEVLGAMKTFVATIQRAHKRSAKRLSATDSVGKAQTIVIADFTSRARTPK